MNQSTSNTDKIDKTDKTDEKQPRKIIPRGPSWRTIATLSIVAIVALVLGVTLAKPIRTGLSKTSNVFHRATNSQSADSHAGHAHQTGESQARYTCGMHPWVILTKPGDCPICHMKLVPLDPAKTSSQIIIDPAITQNIGVRTTPVILAPAHRNIQTTGALTWDESALHEVSLKYTGWVEKLHVDTVGQPVTKGQLLFEIYAPAVYVAQDEYLTIWRKQNAGRSHTDTLTDTQTDTRLLAAARRRLQFLDVTSEQIDALEKRNAPEKTIGVYSPADGYVVERNITQGASVQMNQPLYRIADISNVWVMAAIYEQDLPLVENNMPATMSLPYAPGKVYQGTLSYIYPYLDNASRQANARLVFENPDHLLKPGMFAQINLHAKLQNDRLLIPRSAVINTGKRQTVFVAQKLGRFEPRNVTLGANVQDGLVEVTQGLAVNENVVTQSQFLLDSEANMRQTLAMMTIASSDTDQKQSAANFTLSAKNAAALNAFIDTYLAMSEQLATDKNDLTIHAKKLDELATALPNDPMPDQPDFWQKHTQPNDIAELARSLSKPLPLDQTRTAFLKISRAALELLKVTGVPENRKTPIEQLVCEMYKHGQPGEEIPAGGQWLSPQGTVRNPYFGKMMIGCYTDQAKLPVATITTNASSDANPSNKTHEANE